MTTTTTMKTRAMIYRAAAEHGWFALGTAEEQAYATEFLKGGHRVRVEWSDTDRVSRASTEYGRITGERKRDQVIEALTAR